MLSCLDIMNRSGFRSAASVPAFYSAAPSSLIFVPLQTGLVQIVHGGKPTILTERHAGIDPDAVRASLRKDESTAEVARLKELHGDRTVVAGVERVEKIKGVWLKLLAFEDMLRRHPDLVGR